MDEAMSAAVAACYDAALRRGTWEGALDRLLGALGYDGAALYMADRAADVFGQPEGLPRGIWHRLDPATQLEYERHYAAIDPRLAYVQANPGRRLLHDYLHTAETEIDRSEYYDWYQRAQGTRYYLGGINGPEAPFLLGLTLHRRGEAGPATVGEQARLAPLLDHLERALLVEHHLRLTHAAGPDAAEAGRALLLLAADGRVLHANTAGRAVLTRADALRTDAGLLRAVRAVDDAALAKAIGEALAAGVPGLLRLARRPGADGRSRRDYLVSVAPVAGAGGVLAPWQPALAVLIADPDDVAEPPLATLRRLFGLTEAEARLAAALAVHGKLDTAAAACGVALTTARSHLAAVFRKTGTDRQAELIRILLSVNGLTGPR